MRWGVFESARVHRRLTRAPQGALLSLCLLFCFALLGGCVIDHSPTADWGDDSGARDDGGRDDAETDSTLGGGGFGDGDGGMLTDGALPSDGSVATDSRVPATLVRIEVQPLSGPLAKGTSRKLSAAGVYSDNTARDLTGWVTWSSSDQAIVTVSESGLATGVALGTATLTAQFGSVSGSGSLTVTAATLVSIDLSPATGKIAVGTSTQLVASGRFSDATTQDLTATAKWISSAAGIATVTNDGRVTGVAPGQVTITAGFGEITGSVGISVSNATLVSIALTPTNASLAKGTSVAFVAVGSFSDDSTQDLTSEVTWASSAEGVATISNADGSRGLAHGVAAGETTISASKGAVVGSTDLTVTSASLTSIVVSPAGQSFPAGTSQPYSATGHYSDGSTQDLTQNVVWASSDAAVLTISNSSATAGLASGVRAGTASVSASAGAVSGSAVATVTPAVLTSLTVTPAATTIARGTTQQFAATGTYTDGSTRDLTSAVAWSSSLGTVAAISNAAGSEGLATGLVAGQTNITAASGAISASTTLTVTNSILISIAITPANGTLAVGTNQAFVAVGTYSDNTKQDVTKAVTWKSTDPKVAAISNAAGSEGTATALTQGATLISATLGTTLAATLLTVTPATIVSIEVTPAAITLAKGATQQYRARATFSDGSVQDVTSMVNWASSQGTVASIINARAERGLVRALAAGQTTISATRNGVVGSTTLTVKEVVSIAVTPATPSIALGTTLQFAATGTYSDKSTADLTQQVTWSSSNQAVAIISNLAASRGLASAVRAGMTTIRATLTPGLSGTTLATVK